MKTDDTKGEYNIDRIRIENSALRKYAAIQKSAEETIGVQKVYVDIAGDIEAAFVLDEIIFFTLPRSNGKSGLRIWKGGYQWMAVQRADWWDRKRLTPRQADTAISKLEEQNLIFKEIHKFNGQTSTHLRLNPSEFFKRYGEELERQNPPENDADTSLKEINDLYEMMGINSELQNGDSQFRQTELQIGDTELQIGDSINIPPQPSLNPIGDKSPIDLPLDWKIANGQDITEHDIQGETDRKMRDAANLISMGFGITQIEAYNLAYAFQVARQIVIPENKIKGQRKAVREMLEMKVRPSHVEQAVKDLTGKKMTVIDLYSVSKTAIDLANPAPGQFNPLERNPAGI
jgi:hypothetical protein